MVPDPAVVLKYLADGEIAIALSVWKAKQFAPLQQFRPHGEASFGVYMMLPAFTVDQGIDVDVPRFI